MLITHDNNRKPDNFLQYQKKKRKEYILNGGIIMKLVPLSDRVVLKQCEAEETTKSGIILNAISGNHLPICLQKNQYILQIAPLLAQIHH